VRTVLITGAGGFTGARLVEYLRRAGYEVVAGVRNRARKLAYERQNVRALVCDVTDPIAVARVVASVRPDAVAHLAGISQPAQAAAEPLEAYQAIVTSCANVLDAVRRAVPRAKVVLASAAEVYGVAGEDGRALAETTEPQPVTTFGSLKLAAEKIAHTFFRDYHLNVTVARPFHYTGPGQTERFFFGAVARRLACWDYSANGHELALPDLDCRRDVLHIDDVVAAYERLLLDGRPNETYNICSGTACTCRELVEEMIAAANLDLRLTDLPAGDQQPRIRALCGDNSKLRSDLRWEPMRSARDAVRELLAFCKSSVQPVAV